MAKIEFTISAENAPTIKALQQVAGAVEQVEKSFKDIGTEIEFDSAEKLINGFLDKLKKIPAILQDIKDTAAVVLGPGFEFNKTMEQNQLGKAKMSDVTLQNEVSMINADRSLTPRQGEDLVDEAARKTHAAKTAEDTGQANVLKEDKNHDMPEINSKLSETKTLLEKVEEAAKQTFENGLLDFLKRGVFECKNLNDAFLNLAKSVLQSIQKVYAEALTKNIMSLLGLGAEEKKKSVLGTTDSTGFYYDPNFGLKPMTSLAEGGGIDSGKVTGPGTETSDSILAWAGNIKKFIRIANGEFVLRGAAVKKYGTAFLERLNSGIVPSGMLQRYAIGGSLTDRIPSGNIIGPQELTANLSNNTTIPLNIMNVVDQGMMGKFLQTREGKKALLNYIKDDAGTIRRVLNIPG